MVNRIRLRQLIKKTIQVHKQAEQLAAARFQPAPAPLTDKPQPLFFEESNEIIKGVLDWLINAPVVNAAGWILGEENRVHPVTNHDSIGPGNVVETELGLQHPGEYGLQHPCLVLRKKGPLLSVVPLTSQDCGKGVIVTDTHIAQHPVLNQDEYHWRVEFQTPGSAKWSVALLEQLRTVSTGRVLFMWVHQGQPLRVHDNVLTAIHRKLAELLAPTIITQLSKTRERNKRLVKDLKKLQDTNRQLREKLNNSGSAAD